MHAQAVDVHFDSSHVFLDFADGPAVEFPLDWFPLLQAASDGERANFAISLPDSWRPWPANVSEIS
jgi:hypothetical protein